MTNMRAPSSLVLPQSFSPKLEPTAGQLHGQPSSESQVGVEVSKWDGAPLPWYIIHPGRKPKMCWDVFAVTILLYAVVMTPVRLTFGIEDYCPSTMWILDTIIDIAFVLDLLFNVTLHIGPLTQHTRGQSPRSARSPLSLTRLMARAPRAEQFVTAVYVVDEGGDSAELTSNLRTIAAAYIKSWFAVDLISSAPVDLCLSLTVRTHARVHCPISTHALPHVSI